MIVQVSNYFLLIFGKKEGFITIFLMFWPFWGIIELSR